MRTTVDVPDPLFRELKATAARRGITLKTIIHSALEAEVRKQHIRTTKRVKYPILSSREPGSLNLTNAEIEDLLT